MNKMKLVVNRTTGNECPVIQWTGHNIMQVIQFGMSPRGKMIKVDCAKNCTVYQCGQYRRVRPGSYIVLEKTQEGEAFSVVTKELLDKYYEGAEKENE